MGYEVKLSGKPFNDAYRYVDWVLTVPLLLIELILVMGLPPAQTVTKSWTLGVASALMVGLGYPGEIQDEPAARWKWGSCHGSVSLCCVRAGHWLEQRRWQAGTVGRSADGLRSMAHDCILVDLSLRVHHQDARYLWCGSDSWRADWIFVCRCDRQSSLRSLDLGHCRREEQD